MKKPTVTVCSVSFLGDHYEYETEMGASPHHSDHVVDRGRTIARAHSAGRVRHHRREQPLSTVRVLVPTGMLGGGFPAATVRRGIALGADVIAVDGGSTDSGPHYLGTATAKTARAAVGSDLRAILAPARAAGVPVVIGSCGTAGTDAGVDWVYDIAADIIADGHLHLRVARIYSEQGAPRLERLLADGRIHP
ncbi:MAG: hypothetical protein QOE62_2630, partial [Actinomycetota bacterium]|nr:hypothetical protein [Actinomycetota bacterium]